MNQITQGDTKYCGQCLRVQAHSDFCPVYRKYLHRSYSFGSCDYDRLAICLQERPRIVVEEEEE